MKHATQLILLILSFHFTTQAQRAALPYFYDFESGMNGWVSSDDGLCGTSWELGTPTFGWTIGAYSGDFCMDVNLNTGYTNNSVCYLISPVFDFSFVNRATISFWTKYKTEYLWDYLAVQYTVDKGDHWSYLPFPLLVNPDGFVEKWIKSELAVTQLYGYSDVQFRLAFTSDGSITFDGYSVDDFRIDPDALGVPVTNNQELFTVYPNPSMGIINLNVTGTFSNNSFVSILDVTGKVVFSKSFEDYVGNSLRIDHLNQGIYTVLFQNEGVHQLKKFVVMQ